MTDSTGQDQQANMRKVAMTSLAGTSIEWYDFFLYATAAALIFPSAFFPEDFSPTVTTILSLATFAAGFVARPIGGLIFGHFGDRVGRKKTLVIALMMMGVATTLIGFLPTYASIGVAAPLLLVTLRFVQGLAIGGQWGGAMLLVTESAPADQRGWYGAYAQAGAPMGVVLANLAFMGVSFAVGDEAFREWGWRIPFIASVVLIGISMYVQLKIEDTDAFKRLAGAQKKSENSEVTIQRSPIIEAIRKYPRAHHARSRRILINTGHFLHFDCVCHYLREWSSGFERTAQSLHYARNSNRSCRDNGPNPILFLGAVRSCRTQSGIRWGAILTGMWAFVLFPLINTQDPALVLCGVTVGLLFLGMQYGPQAAYFTELFSTEVRYSGASLGYQLGAILGGALAPIIAVLLWKNFGITYVSVYIAFAAVLTLLSLSRLDETQGKSL